MQIMALAEPENREVVVYCSVGYRSSAIAASLQELGVSVRNLRRSIFGWANQGLPLENAAGVTLFVHPFDETWGRLLNNNVPQRHKPVAPSGRDAIQ